MLRPVVANEERKDQRKRVWQQNRCQTDAPFEEDARWGRGCAKLSWKAGPKRVKAPCRRQKASKSRLLLESR